MGRQRKPQSQYRMFYKEHDHREIIMDDQYHGAIYIGDNPEHAWRKYKPCLLTTSCEMINAVDEPSPAYLPGGLISIDTENKYFSCYSNWQFQINSSDMFFGNILYRNFSNGQYFGCASKNGYDWKIKKVDSFFKRHNYTSSHIKGEYIGGYGRYALIQGDNGYDIYSLDYNEGDNEFIGPTLVSHWENATVGQEYLGNIYNEYTRGALFKTKTYGHGSEKLILYTEDDFSPTVVWENNEHAPNYDFDEKEIMSNMFYINDTYFIFILRNLRDNPVPYYSGSYKNYTQLKVLTSTTGSQWEEREVTSISLLSTTVDDGRSQISTLYSANCSGTVMHMIYYDSTYYIYTYENDTTYTITQNYRWVNNHKVIYSTSQTSMYGKIIAFSSSNLSHWQKHNLPSYLDILFYDNSDITEGRHGIGINHPKFSSIRYILDGRLLRTAVSPTTLLNEHWPWWMDDNVPNPFGVSLINGGNLRNDYVINNAIINGKIKQDSSHNNEGIWLCYLLDNYMDGTMQTYKCHKYICVNIKNPLFEFSYDSYAYQLTDNAEPEFAENNNIDPIDPSDYIFEQ